MTTEINKKKKMKKI